jgi:hypothetical protein
LPREIDLLETQGRDLVMDFARRFGGRLLGLVIHDQPEIASRFKDYIAVLGRLDAALREIPEAPLLFVEYASGLAPALYLALFQSIRDLQQVSSCIDTGHIGLRRARDAYDERHPGEDVCAIKVYDTELPRLIGDVQYAVGCSLDGVLEVVRAIGSLGKPLHFHLHDGHPLWTLSPFPISDHLSFLTQVTIPFKYEGRESLLPMFGPSGLARIVAEALRWLDPATASFCLEIHPTEGRTPLGDGSFLFQHWKDKSNAERMSFWLSVLQQNAFLLRESRRWGCGKTA